jgi:hypothetical protein
VDALAGPDAGRLDAHRGREMRFPAKDHDSPLAVGHGFLLAKAAVGRQAELRAHPAPQQPDAHQKAVVAGVVSAVPVVADAALVAVKEQALERSTPSAGPGEDSPDESELLLVRRQELVPQVSAQQERERLAHLQEPLGLLPEPGLPQVQVSQPREPRALEKEQLAEARQGAWLEQSPLVQRMELPPEPREQPALGQREPALVERRPEALDASAQLSPLLPLLPFLL